MRERSTMVAPENDEFYVGYLPKAPPHQSRHTAFVVSVIVLVSMLSGTLVVRSMNDPGTGSWDDGTPVHYRGTLIKRPYPMIRMDAIPDGGRKRVAILTDFGKRGAQHRLESFAEGDAVDIVGYPIHRDTELLIELAPDEEAVTLLSHNSSPPSRTLVGQTRTLMGQIVDPKCFLGAMKPGEGKTHKACAIRCIAGGIPPVLACQDADHQYTYYIIASPTGEPFNSEVLDHVAEPISVSGSFETIDDALVFRIDPASIRPAQPSTDGYAGHPSPARTP